MLSLLSYFFFLAQTTTSSESSGEVNPVFWCCYGIVALIIIAGMWAIFGKAGKPGWAAIIPFYNIYVLLQIVGRPTWWIILFFIPFINFIVSILVYFDLAKSFGKGQAYGCGILILPFIFIPLLGFGDAQYEGPAAG